MSIGNTSNSAAGSRIVLTAHRPNETAAPATIRRKARACNLALTLLVISGRQVVDSAVWL
ncbi:MAG: hypothetical protein OXG04_06175 [Acidobacteria bacterium]|nr:hypothetical protein [Acidobacteriota bacterium]